MVKKQKFRVEGMGCAACVASVEKHTKALNGVITAEVNLLLKSMIVTYESEDCNEQDICDAVKNAGFEAFSDNEEENTGEDDETAQAGMRQREERKAELLAKEKRKGKWMKVRLILSVVFWLPLMFLAMYHMFAGILPQPVTEFLHNQFEGTENAQVYVLYQFLLLVPIVCLNYSYFSKGLTAAVKGRPNMDTLIALGSLAAIGYGIFAMIEITVAHTMQNEDIITQYKDQIYFETAGTILTLITVGKYLESISRSKTRDAIEQLLKLSPETAIVIRNDEEVVIPTQEVRKNDIFICKPGSRIPVDGVIINGHGSVDESAISGESMPVDKTAGNEVISATVNLDGVIKCRATHVGRDTTLSKIVRLVEEAGMKKAPIASLADKVAGVFVPTVLGIAMITLIIWLIAGAGFEFAMSCAISVLVISCPCALGLATPVAIMVGSGIGAQNGILIKSGESLQTAGEVNTVVFDKTGTLTKGKPQVKEITVWKEGFSKQEILLLAAGLESGSEHPLGQAVVSEASSIKSVNRLESIEEFRAIPGRGISACAKGHAYLIGNRDMMLEHGITISDTHEMRIRQAEDKANTPLLMSEDAVLIGIFSIADSLKDTSKDAIGNLKSAGIKAVMLTGDSKRVAKRIADEVGIDQIFSQVLPWEKEKCIRDLKEDGKKVAMVGDGINDAPPLVAADVGIAIGAGTDIAIESADIVLMHSDPMDVYRAITLSREVMRNIKENLFWAFFYNIIGIPLAAGILYPMFEIRMNPMFAAAAMSFSSLFVVGNALRLRLNRRKWKKK